MAKQSLDIDPIPPEPDSRSGYASYSFLLEPDDAKHIAVLCGHLNAHLKLISDRLEIAVSNRGNQFSLSGPEHICLIAESLIRQLYREIAEGLRLSVESLHLRLQQADLELLALAPADSGGQAKGIKTKRGTIKPRGHNRSAMWMRFDATT